MKTICDLHTHSVLSNHAYSSLTENIKAANDIGLKYYGITEHQPDNYEVGAKKDAFNALGFVPNKVNDTYILRGVELNILEDGEINPDGIRTNHIEYGVASIHQYAYFGNRDIDSITNAYLTALDNKLVTILGHIHNIYYPCDFKKVGLKAKENHKLIELNNAKVKNKPIDDENKKIAIEMLEAFKEIELPIIMDSDSHICYTIGHVEEAESLIDYVDYPKELILNYNEELFKEYFKIEE